MRNLPFKSVLFCLSVVCAGSAYSDPIETQVGETDSLKIMVCNPAFLLQERDRLIAESLTPPMDSSVSPSSSASQKLAKLEHFLTALEGKTREDSMFTNAYNMQPSFGPYTQWAQQELSGQGLDQPEKATKLLWAFLGRTPATQEIKYWAFLSCSALGATPEMEKWIRTAPRSENGGAVGGVFVEGPIDENYPCTSVWMHLSVSSCDPMYNKDLSGFTQGVLTSIQNNATQGGWIYRKGGTGDTANTFIQTSELKGIWTSSPAMPDTDAFRTAGFQDMAFQKKVIQPAMGPNGQDLESWTLESVLAWKPLPTKPSV